MDWCCQATSHYLSQRWPRSMSPHGVIRPQWVNVLINHVSLDELHHRSLWIGCIPLSYIMKIQEMLKIKKKYHWWWWSHMMNILPVLMFKKKPHANVNAVELWLILHQLVRSMCKIAAVLRINDDYGWDIHFKEQRMIKWKIGIVMVKLCPSIRHWLMHGH